MIIIKGIPCNNADECVTNLDPQLESNGIANTGVIALGIVILFITFVAILVCILYQGGLSPGEKRPEEPREQQRPQEPPLPPPQLQTEKQREEEANELANSTKWLIISFVVFNFLRFIFILLYYILRL